MTRKRIAIWSALAVLPLAAFVACESEESPAPGTATPTASAGGTGTGTGTAGTGGDISIGGNAAGGASAGGGNLGGYNTGGIPMPTEIATCQGKIYACGDLLDNDGDGLVDSQDPDCLGPCDNTEDSYFGGIPGQTGPACKVDCYFDQDSGSGNDQCYWDHICDPLSVDPNYYPEPWEDDACEYAGPDELITPIHETCDTLLNADGQKPECLDFCLPLTPNGCDCFGCCELPAGSDDFVWLGSEGVDGTTVCTHAEIDNPDICHPCTPVTDCMNDCGYCEICIGKPTIPPECYPGSGGGTGSGGGPGDRCDPGIQACGVPGDEPCPSGYFCLTGCCMELPT